MAVVYDFNVLSLTNRTYFRKWVKYLFAHSVFYTMTYVFCWSVKEWYDMFTSISCITLQGQIVMDYKWLNMFKFILCTVCKSAVHNLENNLLMMIEKWHGRKEAWSSFWYYSRWTTLKMASVDAKMRQSEKSMWLNIYNTEHRKLILNIGVRDDDAGCVWHQD